MAETFFAELAHFTKSWEVLDALNKLALQNSVQVKVTRGVGQGIYPIDEDHRPVLGLDKHVRVGQYIGMGAGITPENVELIPRPNLQELVKQLQPELQTLILLGRK